MRVKTRWKSDQNRHRTVKRDIFSFTGKMEADIQSRQAVLIAIRERGPAYVRDDPFEYGTLSISSSLLCSNNPRWTASAVITKTPAQRTLYDHSSPSSPSMPNIAEQTDHEATAATLRPRLVMIPSEMRRPIITLRLFFCFWSYTAAWNQLVDILISTNTMQSDVLRDNAVQIQSCTAADTWLWVKHAVLV